MHLRRVAWTRRALLLCALVCLSSPEQARPQKPDPDSPAERPSSPDNLVADLVDTWLARDFHGYLALWEFASPEEREREAAMVREAFAADDTSLRVLGRPRQMEGTTRLAVDVQAFSAAEPRARVDYWRLLLEQRGRRWTIVDRQAGTEMEGLIHLPLAAEARRVRGAVLRQEDFELHLEDGLLFSTPDSLGPTALVFVGRGRVRFSPHLGAERRQLEVFAGSERLDRTVRWAFLRLHPDEFESLIAPSRLGPDPRPDRRRQEAVKLWEERIVHSYIVDTALPGSPWWLVPDRGDILVEFPWKGRVLTYARAQGESEDVNLFQRDRNLVVCSYASQGRPSRSRAARGGTGAVDVLHHDLTVRFDPARFALNAVDTLRLRLLAPVSTVRLKLHDDFRVSSVSSQSGGDLLFLRAREQGSLVVSLRPDAGQWDELSLTVRYSGRHDPLPMKQELLQLFPEPGPAYAEHVLLSPPPLIYTNRTAWYPRPNDEDFATLSAHFDTPKGIIAVTGGELVSTRTAEGRTRATYELREPGKFFSAVVGRLQNLGVRRAGDQMLRGFADPRRRNDTREDMATAGDLLAFFAERYGPCPYPNINQTTAEGKVPAGHSPPGLIYLQRRPAMLRGQPLAEDPADFSDRPNFFLAHELAHQWWGQGVAPASYRDQWLSEAWAQYSAALWVRHRAGEPAFRDMLDRMARWARRHDDDGPIDLGHRLGHLENDTRIQRAIVYDKGALVLHMLRQIMGDEAFFGGARRFLERHRFARATTEDLRAAFEEACARDLEPYFERWIYGTGLPSLRWTARTRETPEGFETTVHVQPEGLPGPVPLHVLVRTEGAPVASRVDLEPAGSSWTITSPDPVRKVEVNDDRALLAEVKKVRRLSRP